MTNDSTDEQRQNHLDTNRPSHGGTWARFTGRLGDWAYKEGAGPTSASSHGERRCVGRSQGLHDSQLTLIGKNGLSREKADSGDAVSWELGEVRRSPSLALAVCVCVAIQDHQHFSGLCVAFG